MTEYHDFLESKKIIFKAHGVNVTNADLHPVLFDFQRDVTRWLCQKGRAACFLDTGLGKTPIQCEWARVMDERTLIIAPLSVARQTVRIAKELLDMDIDYVREQTDVKRKFNITNYEMIKHFDFSRFGSVALDESSILKAIAGKTRKLLTRLCAQVTYRSCYSATPAPNDHVELGNHAEFLGVMTAAEMRAQFFINANKEHTFVHGGKAYHKKGSNKGGQEWRLRHHGEDAFFRWLSSWAVALTKPSDLGYDDDGYILPSLNIRTHFVEADYVPEGQLFFTKAKGIADAAMIRRETLPMRLDVLKDIIDADDEQWIVWTGLDDESAAATEAFENVAEVKGSQSPEFKATRFESFQDRLYRILVTKPRIGGYGMNFQNAHNMAFLGLNHSWENFYQSIRREWRFGQEYEVNVHIILSDIENAIWHNIQRKDAMAARLREGLIGQIKDYTKGEMQMTTVDRTHYETETVKENNWTAMLGDSCERMKELEDDSIDLSVQSPPFADLYTYTDSERDLGNSRDWGEFFRHYAYIIRQMLRVTKPGRLACVHCMDIPAMKQKDGYMGLKDFSGAIIGAYEAEGWIFHDRVIIDKSPQAQAIRTHSHGLAFKTLRKDSVRSHTAIPDQVLVFRKEGDNKVPVTPVRNGDMDNEVWIRWARPIWYAADYTPGESEISRLKIEAMPEGFGHKLTEKAYSEWRPRNPDGIAETNTLQFTRARDTGDEKHICPLQLGTIERCIKLWSNPGEVILSPFAGIGSEGYIALKFKRRFIGIEIKDKYYHTMCKNLRAASDAAAMPDLFSVSGVEVG